MYFYVKICKASHFKYNFILINLKKKKNTQLSLYYINFSRDIDIANDNVPKVLHKWQPLLGVCNKHNDEILVLPLG